MIAAMLSALAFAMAPAQAAGTKIGTWKIEPQGGNRCHMIAPFGAHQIVSVSRDAAGGGTFIVYDDRWKLSAPRTYGASYSWDGWKGETAATLKSFTSSNGVTLLGMRVDADFAGALTDAHHIWLRIPELGFTGDFAIPESERLFAALRDCTDNLDGEAGARVR